MVLFCWFHTGTTGSTGTSTGTSTSTSTTDRAASPGAPIKEHYYKVHLNEEVNLREHQDQDWEQV